MSLHGGLVVSCQARAESPLHGPLYMAAMAEAAVKAGAVGIRANGAADVGAIRARVSVPILGINKLKAADGTVFITPSCESAIEVIEAGAQLVALDGTDRPRKPGESLADVIRCIKEHGAAALADVSTLEEGRRAVEAGADAVGTTLSGYTSWSPQQKEPDFALIQALAREVQVPVFAEGRIWTPAESVRALECGASFVVVGTAITNPAAIAERYVDAIRHAGTQTH
ncbi:MAG: N-acetylmannosamine-6-phosphate 2-epimerase [Chloroflexi bacterium]|nr:N-acetylmannosamine-6-phosphate 2-epimerase [Chloroflexota bacterium]